MDIKKVYKVVTLLLVISLLIPAAITPVSAQSAEDGGINASDLVDELRQDADETDIYQTLDTDTYIQEVEWDEENNTAYLTIVSKNREQLTIYDYNTFLETQTARFQKYQIKGEKTIQVDAVSQGIQKLSVSTENRVSLVKSGESLDLGKKILWYVSFAVLLFYIIIMVIYRKAMYDRKRLKGVFDLVSGELIETVFKSDTIDTSTWKGKVKYAYRSGLEGFLDKIIFNPLWLAFSVFFIFAVDYIINGGAMWYTLMENRWTRIGTLLSVPSAILGYVTAGWIRRKFHNPRDVILLVLDEGKIGDEELEELDDLKDVIENYGEVETGGIRVLEMAEEVYNRFNFAISEDCHEHEYSADIEQDIKIARRVDLEEARIVPNWQELYPPEDVLKSKQLAKENNSLLQRYADSIKRLIGASSGIEEVAMRRAYKQIAEDLEKALGDDESLTIEEFVEEIMKQKEIEGDSEEEALRKLSQAMEPSSEKKNIEKGDNDE